MLARMGLEPRRHHRPDRRAGPASRDQRRLSNAPKPIQIVLPSGEPHGIRIAEITTRIVKVIEVPRSLLADFLAMEQSSQVGVYVLVGEDTGDDDRRVYVGQSGDLRVRLAQHHQKKDFCRSPGAGVDGRGVYTPQGFVVLAGSVGPLENVPSIQGTNDGRLRERLIAAGVMEVS